jgi:hypothetical protein
MLYKNKEEKPEDFQKIMEEIYISFVLKEPKIMNKNIRNEAEKFM